MSAEISTFETLPLKDLVSFINQKEAELLQYDEAVKAQGDYDNARLDILKGKHQELDAAKDRLTRLNEADSIVQTAKAHRQMMNEPDPTKRIPFQTGTPQNGNGQQSQAAVKSLGELFTESHAYKSMGSHEVERKSYSVGVPDVDFQSFLKTTMTTSAGYAPPNDRTSIVVPYAQRTPRLTDVIPSDPTALSSIKYMEETTALAGTIAQVSITEGNAKFENTLAFTERTSPVETIGTWLPVTVQQLDDVPGIRGIIDNRLLEFLRLVEEDILLTGNGTPPQLSGFLDRALNTQARGVDTNLDCIFKGIQYCRITGFAEPDAVIMHPTNFTPIATYKSTTGEYSFDPLTVDGGVMRLWGKPLILTTAITVGTALVGAFRLYSHISRKMGMTIQVGLNASDFTTNKRTILAEFRESLEVYRATAFTQCTGLQ
jgi:HK97 family phage major capsid protein